MSKQSLRGIKPGDKVILDIHFRDKEVVEVTRVMPTLVYAACRKFTKKDADAIRLRKQQQRVHQIDATKLTAEQCEAILAIAYPKENEQ